jgi:hypothetical protein
MTSISKQPFGTFTSVISDSPVFGERQSKRDSGPPFGAYRGDNASDRTGDGGLLAGLPGAPGRVAPAPQPDVVPPMTDKDAKSAKRGTETKLVSVKARRVPVPGSESRAASKEEDPAFTSAEGPQMLTSRASHRRSPSDQVEVIGDGHKAGDHTQLRSRTPSASSSGSSRPITPPGEPPLRSAAEEKKARRSGGVFEGLDVLRLLGD